MMATGKRSRTIRSAIAVAVLGLQLLPNSAFAQDCSDKTKLLSEQWWFAKIDCGADKLLESGVGILTETGLNIAKGTIREFLPSVAELLFGPEDRYAAHIEELKTLIQSQGTAIINTIKAERREEQSTALISALEEIQNINNDGPYDWAATVDSINNVDLVLHKLSIDLMWPEQTPYSPGVAFSVDYSAQIPRDVDRLDSLMALVALRIGLSPKLAIGEAIAANLYGGAAYDEEARATEKTAFSVNLMLDEFDTYLRAVDTHDLFRGRSDERFSTSSSGGCDGGFGRTVMRKAAVGVDPSSSDAQVWTATWMASNVIVQGGVTCTTTGPVTGATVGSSEIKYPDGTTRTFTMTAQEHNSQVAMLYATEKYLAYLDFLLAAYGSAVPTLTRWYQEFGRPFPELEINHELTDALRRNAATRDILDSLQARVIDPMATLDWKAAESTLIQGNYSILDYFIRSTSYDYMNASKLFPVQDIRAHFLNVDPNPYAFPSVFTSLATAKTTAITDMLL